MFFTCNVLRFSSACGYPRAQDLCDCGIRLTFPPRSFYVMLLGIMEVSMVRPKCARCRRTLELTEMNRGATLIFGNPLPVLYIGIVCQSCGRIECGACKTLAGRIDAPCSACGGAVKPAYENYVRPQQAFRAGYQAGSRRIIKSAFLLVFSIILVGLIFYFVSRPLILKRTRSAYADTIYKMAQIRKSMSLAGISWPVNVNYDFRALLEDLENKNVSLDGSYTIRDRFTNPALDAWGNPFFFKQIGGINYLISPGANGRVDHGDPLHEKPLPVIKGGDIFLRDWDFVHRPSNISRLPIILKVTSGWWTIPLD